MAPSLEVISMNPQNHHGGGRQEPHHHDDLSEEGTTLGLPTATDETTEAPDVAPPSPTSTVDHGNDDQHITRPGEHDVLLGRGGGTNNHSGNVKFRKLVNEHKMRYLACSKVDKPKVAREVVQLWRKMNPPGRFLARKDAAQKKGPGSVKAADNVWYEVGDKKAREKASQCLRERTPDVLPYIQQLREQQDAMTEHGVSLVQAQMQLAGGAAGQGEGAGPFPRRNSMPAMGQPNGNGMNPANGAMMNPNLMNRRASNPCAPTMQGQQTPWPMPPGSMGPAATMNNGGNMTAPMNNGAVAPFEDEAALADMTDLEYEHLMRLQQQQLQMQHVALQRLRQQRLGLRHAGSSCSSMNGGAAPGQGQGNNMGMPPPNNNNMNGGMRSNGFPMNNNSQQFSPQGQPAASSDDPLPVQHADPVLDTGTAGTKRSRTAMPDAAPSNPHAAAGGNETGELTLEDYRQQLEEYMMRHPEDGQDGGSHDDGDASDLEDDWEKERDRNQGRCSSQQQDEPERGVDRNASFMSFMTEKSGFSKLGNMSLVSGVSAFSDLSMVKDHANNNFRESKMSMTRSVGSNLSLMSDMTDLSQNIDNLSLLDD